MKKILLFAATISALPSLSYATPDGLNALSKVPQATVTAVERALAKQSVMRGGRLYNPVLGFIFQPHTNNVVYNRVLAVDRPVFNGFADWDYKGPEAINKLKVQVEPLFTAPEPLGYPDERFVSIDQLSSSQLAGALWLWRAANPGHQLKDFPHTQALYNQGNRLVYLVTQTQRLSDVKEPARRKMIIDAKNNLPSVKLISRLIDPDFTPQSFSQLESNLSVYPKYVVLNKDGFPTPAPEADQADFVEARPVFSGEVDFAVGGVDGDAVEDIGAIGAKVTGEEAAAIDGSLDFAVGRIDDDYEVRHVNVRPDLSVNPLQLVEIAQGPAFHLDGQGLFQFEILAEKIQS